MKRADDIDGYSLKGETGALMWQDQVVRRTPLIRAPNIAIKAFTSNAAKV